MKKISLGNIIGLLVVIGLILGFLMNAKYGRKRFSDTPEHKASPTLLP